jgi:hypothetical protein
LCLAFALSRQMMGQKPLQSLSKIFVGWEANEVPHYYCPFSTPFPQTGHAPFNASGFPASYLP